MRILITGSNGQLGSELQRQLREMQSPLGPLPEVYRGAAVTAVDREELDITCRDAVMETVGRGGFELIINCAAHTAVDRAESEFDAAFAVNALAPGYLAEAAEASGAKLLHLSTDYVFAGDGSSPLTEADLPRPVTVYGRTKLLGEQRVQAFCKRHFILRTAWLYGYRGNNFVKTIMNAARTRGEVRVVNDQFGTPTSAVDLAHAVLLVGAGENYGLYHATCSGECSWYDFASEILRLAGIDAACTPCTTEEYPTAARRPAYSVLDNAMLRATVGDIMRSWQQAIAEYIQNLPEMEG